LKKAILIGLALLLLTFGAGYLIAARVLFPPLPAPQNGIAVPDLSGIHEREADAKLRALGLQRGQAIEFAHPNQMPGIIIGQNPLPGQQLRAGGVVQLAVSSGLPRVQVPDVIGFDVARATAVLSQLGLTADQQTEVNERPAGTVLRIMPEPGQSQPVPARVVLVVSAGPPPAPTDSTIRTDTLGLTTGNEPNRPDE
jgi:eukaryotic-like serine/threonine-protein kinase